MGRREVFRCTQKDRRIAAHRARARVETRSANPTRVANGGADNICVLDTLNRSTSRITPAAAVITLASSAHIPDGVDAAGMVASYQKLDPR